MGVGEEGSLLPAVPSSCGNAGSTSSPCEGLLLQHTLITRPGTTPMMVSPLGTNLPLQSRSKEP